MTTPTGPVGDDDPADAEVLAAYADALADGVEAALPAWVERAVAHGHAAQRRNVSPAMAEAARDAGRRAAAEVGGEVRALLARDVDDQPTGPLALVRTAVLYPTAVLSDAGIPPVDRDEVAVRLHPTDLYDLSPASFADLDPALQEPGIVWGAAKAHVVLARRRREGQR